MNIFDNILILIIYLCVCRVCVCHMCFCVSASKTEYLKQKNKWKFKVNLSFYCSIIVCDFLFVFQSCENAFCVPVGYFWVKCFPTQQGSGLDITARKMPQIVLKQLGDAVTCSISFFPAYFDYICVIMFVEFISLFLSILLWIYLQTDLLVTAEEQPAMC